MTNYNEPSHIPDLGQASHTEHNNKCDQKLINLLLRVIGYSQKYFGYRLRVTNSALPVSLTQTFTLTLYMFISNAMFKNMKHIVVQKDSIQCHGPRIHPQFHIGTFYILHLTASPRFFSSQFRQQIIFPATPSSPGCPPLITPMRVCWPPCSNVTGPPLSP